MYDYETLYPAVLGKMFPDPDLRRQCKLIMNRYGVEAYHREPRRVRLAVLKLAGPDLEAVKVNVGRALIDYQDVLAWAEYPRAMRTDSWRLPDDSLEKQQHNRVDRGQYQAWLDGILAEDGGHDGQEG